MRIAVLTTSYPRTAGDPSGHFVQAEARALCRAGHDVWVVAPGTEDSVLPGAPNLAWLASGSAFGWPGVAARLRENPLRSVGVLRYLAAARRLLHERGPFDRIVAHWLLPCGFPLTLAASRSAELELVAHGSDVRLLQKAPALARLALRALLARGATLRCVSQELADALVRLEPRTSASLRVEPCAIDLGSTPGRAAARTELGVTDTRLVIFVARLVDGKRPAAALRSLSLLPFARCVVIGDGPRRASLEREFPTAEFLGNVDREVCLRWIAAADLVLSASTLEGAPSVVREARALGTAVVVAPAAISTPGAKETTAFTFSLAKPPSVESQQPPWSPPRGLTQAAQQLHSGLRTTVNGDGPDFTHLAGSPRLARAVLKPELMLASELPHRPGELVYDRRQSPRIVLEAPALVDAFHTWRKCAVKSVSTTGISVLVDLDLPLGTRADIYFEIPRALAVEVHAEVVRRADGELAFRFLDLSPDSAESIAMYVQSHSSAEPPAHPVIC